MRRFILEGSPIHCEADFHDRIQELLGFFPEYGRNLDALADVLNDGSGLMRERPPFEVVWKDSRIARESLRSDFDRIAEVFKASPVRLVCE